MTFALRFFGYVFGGGALLAWANPQPGPFRWGAILLFIVAAAYVDTILTRVMPQKSQSRASSGVVKMDHYRASRRRSGTGSGRPERRTPRPLFETARQVEAENLVALMRAKNLHPIMVSRKLAEGDAGVTFEVRLPESEIPRAKSLISQYFSKKSAPHD